MNAPFLSESLYENEKFKDQDLRNSHWEGKEFYDCTFHACRLAESTLLRCTFVDCVFEKCDLSLVNVPQCTFQNTTFKKTRLVGINWAKMSWKRTNLQVPFHFHECNISYCNFFGICLKGCSLIKCMVNETDFAEANLTDADCQRSDFRKTRFFHTNLTRANFKNASEYQIDPLNNTLKKTIFNLPEAVALLNGLDIILDESD